MCKTLTYSFAFMSLCCSTECPFPYVRNGKGLRACLGLLWDLKSP